MRKLKLFTHCTILATTPTLLAYPEHNVPQVSFQVVNQRPKRPLPQANPQTVSWLGDWWWGTQEQEEQWVRPNTYDEIIQMLEDLESGELERRYSPMQLEKVNDYIATLAKEGILPNEFEEECELEEDTYDLMYGEDSAFQLTRYLENSHEYMIIPAVLNGYSGYDIIQCGKISKAWKKTKKFCKKHKKAIIIGAVVVVAVTAVTVAVVVASSRLLHPQPLRRRQEQLVLPHPVLDQGRPAQANQNLAEIPLLFQVGLNHPPTRHRFLRQLWMSKSLLSKRTSLKRTFLAHPAQMAKVYH